MKMTRSTAVAASAVAALAVTGITYVASASGPAAQAAQAAPAAAVVQQAAPVVQQAAPAVQPAAAPAQALADGGAGKGNEGREGRERRERREHREEGRIHINERTYSAHPGGCITVVSGLGAKTLNIRNDSESTVQVFKGAVCDNGAPIATVGPWSTSDGVKPGHRHHHEGKEGHGKEGHEESVEVEHGVVASFRVVRHHHHGGEFGEFGEGGERGERGEGFGENNKR